MSLAGSRFERLAALFVVAERGQSHPHEHRVNKAVGSGTWRPSCGSRAVSPAWSPASWLRLRPWASWPACAGSSPNAQVMGPLADCGIRSPGAAGKLTRRRRTARQSRRAPGTDAGVVIIDDTGSVKKASPPLISAARTQVATADSTASRPADHPLLAGRALLPVPPEPSRIGRFPGCLNCQDLSPRRRALSARCLDRRVRRRASVCSSPPRCRHGSA